VIERVTLVVQLKDICDISSGMVTSVKVRNNNLDNMVNW